MLDAMTLLKETRMESSVFIDVENDPNETGLVGNQFSLITTDEGDLDAKLTTLDPNFAAAMVELFTRAGFEAGDTLAMMVTGSMPGSNIAVLIACEVMSITPIVISSVGASQWGANQPDFNWLDMEEILYDNGFIHHRSIAASIGGRNDMGRLLSPKGRRLIEESIEHHGLYLIKNTSLKENVQERLTLLASIRPLDRYDGFINIGGGVASLGTTFNHKLLPPGIVTRAEVEAITRPGGIEGVLSHFAKSGVPVIHVLNIQRLTEMLGMPYAPIPWPEIGEGDLYSQKRYNLVIGFLSLLVVGGAAFIIGYRSLQQIKQRMEEHEPDSVL